MRILGKNEVEYILKLIKDYYGIEELPFNPKDFIFIKNREGKIFILRKEFQNFIKNLNPSNYGLYIIRQEKNGFRFSIEGSQIFGPFARNRILEIDLKEIFFVSKDKKEKRENVVDGYYIIKKNKDFGGSIQVKNKIVRDYIPKERKIYV